MTTLKPVPALIALLSLPALAQTTTVQQEPGSTSTVQSSPGTTTVQTQPQPPPPGTQVVVNPPPADAPPATTTRVRTSEPPVVVEEHHRDPVAIIATDALYGGVAGVLVGGAVALIDDGNHWQRDLMIGAGVGILAGAGVGIVQAASQSNDSPGARAAADRNRYEGAHSPGGLALAVNARW